MSLGATSPEVNVFTVCCKNELIKSFEEKKGISMTWNLSLEEGKIGGLLRHGPALAAVLRQRGQWD